MAKKQTIKQEKKPLASVKNERYSMSKAKDNGVSMKIIVPANEVEEVRKKVIGNLVKDVTVAGFRKGQAPIHIAQNKIPKEKIKEEILRDILTREYVEAVKKFEVKPIINPQIHIETFDDGTDLEFVADTAEEPVIKLNNYKDKVKGVNAKSKIIVPHSANSTQTQEENKKPSAEEIFDAVLEGSEITIPKVLIDQETNRLVSHFLEELQKLGITLEQYLASQNKKSEEIKEEYEKRAERDLKIEFALHKIADEEKITAEQADIEQAINSVVDETQKAQIIQNPYLLATIIKQQKTIDFLTNL